MSGSDWSKNAIRFFNLARAVRRQAAEYRGLDLPPPPPLAETPFTVFTLWLEEVEAQLGERVLLLCLDEFESGGRVGQEYGLGRMRTDLLVIWPYAASPKGEVQRVVIEAKILYNTLEKTLEVGLPQTWKYTDKCGADEGHLIIFDRRETRSWEEKIFQWAERYEGQSIMVWGM